MVNNVELLKKYKDVNGETVIPLLFTDGKYLCSYPDGTNKHLKKEHLFEEKKEVKVVEPEYFEEQLFDFEDEEIISTGDTLFDNNEFIEEKIPDESEDDDFFKDFL